MQKFQVRVENSAPSQVRPAQSAEWAAKILSASGIRQIADLGCGRLRNLPVFTKYFDDITLVDTELQFERIKSQIPRSKKIRFCLLDQIKNSGRTFDGIFCISVLHVVPRIQERRSLIMAAYDALNDNGLFLVDIPSHETYYSRRCNDENRYLDGWVMGKGQYRTFYRNFTAKELDEFVQKSAKFERVRINNQVKHVTRIFKKIAARR